MYRRQDAPNAAFDDTDPDQAEAILELLIGPFIRSKAELSSANKSRIR